MSNYLNISKTWPFKMIKHTATPGEHFDDDWACEQIRYGEMKRYYQQKWIRSYTTKLQIVTTIEPDDLILYDSNKVAVKTFVWTIAGIGAGGENAWECLFDVTDVVTDGMYWIYQKCELLSVKLEAISEPIYLKSYHRNVRPWKFKNSKNDFGIIFSTGIEMTFMCESDMPANEYTFERDRNAYVDQIHNVSTLSAYPYNHAKMLIGEAPGVAPYIIDIANRVLCCDNVVFNGLRIETPEGAKWDINKVKGYPLIGGSIEVTPAKNLSSLQINDGSAINPGVVMMYNIDTNFFGNGSVVRITEFEII